MARRRGERFARCRVGNHERDVLTITNVMQVCGEITPVNTLAYRLRQAREAAGLSQQQAADAAGVTQGTIGNIEAGLRSRPRDLLAIAAAVKVTPQWLLTGKNPMSPSSAVIPADLLDQLAALDGPRREKAFAVLRAALDAMRDTLSTAVGPTHSSEKQRRAA